MASTSYMKFYVGGGPTWGLSFNQLLMYLRNASFNTVQVRWEAPLVGGGCDSDVIPITAYDVLDPYMPLEEAILTRIYPELGDEF